MTPEIHQLHDAARRYCIERAADWHRRYYELCSNRSDRAGDGYTDAAYGIFPRYNVLDAILAEVEGFTPADFRTLDEARAFLSAAADTAQNLFTKTKTPHPIQLLVTQEERRRFRDFISSADPMDLSAHERLPYRRVLTESEHAEHHRLFQHTWGEWYGGSCNRETPAVTLHENAMSAPDAYSALHRLLADRGITRLFELREYGNAYELDLGLASFTYNGAEGFWKSTDLTWMIYASHESSITFGGLWLIDSMRQILPEFDQYLYRGWDPKLYPPPAHTPDTARA